MMSQGGFPLTKVVGLKNLGNTCFLNAVLQSLASVRSFQTYVRRINIQPKNSTLPLLQAFRETLDGFSDKTESFAPPLEKVPAIKERFLTLEQQDAHEFMQYIITMLNEESEAISAAPTLTALSSLGNQTPHVYSKVFKLKFSEPVNTFKFPSSLSTLARTKESIFTRNPFTGILRSTLECTGCKQRSSPSYQTFIDLSLAIPEEFLLSSKKKLPSLEDCLDLFTKVETVRDVDCSTCTKCISAKKQLTIAHAPQTLCLHIRRLVGMGGPLVKLNVPIRFPLELDLAPFCSFSEPSSNYTSSKPANINVDTKKLKTLSELDDRFSRSPPKMESGGMKSQSYFNTSIVGGSIHAHRPTDHKTEWQFETNEPLIKKKIEKSFGNSTLKYDLVSIIVHHGTHSGGHYTVYRKLEEEPQHKEMSTFADLERSFDPRGHPIKTGPLTIERDTPSKSTEKTTSNPAWYHFSDEVTRRVSEEEVLTAQAYMLYYEKCELE